MIIMADLMVYSFFLAIVAGAIGLHFLTKKLSTDEIQGFLRLVLYIFMIWVGMIIREFFDDLSSDALYLTGAALAVFTVLLFTAYYNVETIEKIREAEDSEK